MKNYICIDGNKAELTDEQMRQLGIEPPKVDPFDVKSGELFYMFDVKSGELFYVFDVAGNVNAVPPGIYQSPSRKTAELVSVGNACKDRPIMEQRALHETLSRLLWRFAMQNGGVPSVNDFHGYIIICNNKQTANSFQGVSYPGLQRFVSREVAQRAIDEIVKPFLAEHSDFVW